nr:alpha/beta-type small acid-soluble spore protein [uncultured Butyricicoccus sp.]
MKSCLFLFVVDNTPTEVGVNLKEGYNGELTSRQAGSVGGQMVKKMIEAYEQNLAARG